MIIIPNTEPDLDYLSKSDIEALDYALEKYSQYETLEMSALTHENNSWKIARNNSPESKAPLIKWEDMITNPEVLEDLQVYSKAIVF